MFYKDHRVNKWDCDILLLLHSLHKGRFTAVPVGMLSVLHIALRCYCAQDDKNRGQKKKSCWVING